MTQLTFGSAGVVLDSAPPVVAREDATTNNQADDFAALLATLFVTPAQVSPAPQDASEAPETQLQSINYGEQTSVWARGTLMPFASVGAAPTGSLNKLAALDGSSTIATGESVATGRAASSAETPFVNFTADGDSGNHNITAGSVASHQLAAIIADAKTNHAGGDAEASASSLDAFAILESHGLAKITDASHVAAQTSTAAADNPGHAFIVGGFSLEALRSERRLISAADINSLLGSEETNSEDMSAMNPIEAFDSNTSGDTTTFAGSVATASGEAFRASSDHAPAVVSQTASALAAEFASLANSKTTDARSLRLDLNPESLGRIAINLEQDAEGNISARLSADTDATHKTLSDNLGEIRRTLEDAGVNVAHLDVGANSNQGANAGSTDERGAHAHARTIDATPPSVVAAPEQQRAALDGRLLSLRA